MAKKKPVAYTKTIDGKQRTLYAYSAADVVKLTFDGWQAQPEPAPAPKQPAAKAAPAKPAAK